MDITGKSVVSSGIYERCFKQDGKLYHHILNPQTGYPYDNGLISVTIISDQSVDGDALSTTWFRPWPGGRAEICREKRRAGCIYHRGL